MSIRNWFNSPRRHAGIDGLEFLHSAETFHGLLTNERMRSDRNGTGFALLQFQSSIADLDDDALALFGEAVQSRLRTTDHVGRFGRGGNDVGVILWDGGIEGAHRFINAVQKHCGNDTPPFKIYLYPTDSPCFDDDDGDSDEMLRTPVIRRDTLNHPLPQVRPLEVLFVQPLPWWKRTMDVLGAGMGLVLLSPLLLLTAVAIKLTSRGPALYSQTRDGLGGRPFTMLKFRSMFVGADAQRAALQEHSEQDGPCFKMTHDPRITRLGRFLRKSCIDELPQLWNVLKGDMTLVGPRPLEPTETREIKGFGRRRMDVTPGLTCIWQVDGKSKVSFTEWMRMDVRYIAIRSFVQDVKLIGQTAAAVVLHRASV